MLGRMGESCTAGQMGRQGLGPSSHANWVVGGGGLVQGDGVRERSVVAVRSLSQEEIERFGGFEEVPVGDDLGGGDQEEGDEDWEEFLFERERRSKM